MSTNTPRLTIINSSNIQSNHPNTTTTATIPIIRSTIDDFREIAREQTFINPTNSIDISIKRYSPLPDISISSVNNNTFFRTETIFTTPKQIQTKKQIFNHFAPTQRAYLPTLNKRQNLSMTNVMDLDEDLPQCNTNSTYRAATYTSPGERIISPIKRPSAPSPPSSAQIKRLGTNSLINDDDDDDDDNNDNEEEEINQHYSSINDEDSQLFNEHFYHYQQPIIMNNNRRINHYNPNNRIEKHPKIIIHDEFAHPLDSNEFEP